MKIKRVAVTRKHVLAAAATAAGILIGWAGVWIAARVKAGKE
jgi:hypothetical protein